MDMEEFIIKFYACDSQEQFLKDVNHNLNCLQQENQQLKELVNGIREERDYLFNKLTFEKLQLKERIEYLQRSISRKEETIKNLQNELIETPKEVELENRIDKAIEYIENCDPDNLNSMFLNESYISNYGACELLKILKGENND